MDRPVEQQDGDVEQRRPPEDVTGEQDGDERRAEHEQPELREEREVRVECAHVSRDARHDRRLHAKGKHAECSAMNYSNGRAER